MIFLLPYFLSPRLLLKPVLETFRVVPNPFLTLLKERLKCELEGLKHQLLQPYPTYDILNGIVKPAWPPGPPAETIATDLFCFFPTRSAFRKSCRNATALYIVRRRKLTSDHIFTSGPSNVDRFLFSRCP